MTPILIDTSSSMNAMSGYKRRIDVLAGVLNEVLQPPVIEHKVFSFNSFVEPLSPSMGRSLYDLPEPSGGTDLAQALVFIAPLHPEKIIVISDGEPNSPQAALDAAKILNCHITTRFVGSDDDFAAIAFMRALAWCSSDGLGDARVMGLDRPGRLTTDLRGLLTYAPE